MKLFGNTQWWQGNSQYANINSDGTTSISGGGGTFVDRGDPAAYDWVKANFTTDNTWRDLDCSSIVPSGAKSILFWCSILSSGAQRNFLLRKKGNSNEYNVAQFSTQVSGVVFIQQCIIPCSTARVVQYRANNVTWDSINLVVLGWWT